MYQNFIGIDIGKFTFVVSQNGVNGTKEYDNNKAGFDVFFNDQEWDFNKSLVIIETTGGYEKALIRFLIYKSIDVHRCDTRKVKSFMRSLGTIGKSDSIDAKGLVKYGLERHHSLKLYVDNDEFNDELLKLAQRRTDLKKMLVQEKNRLQAPENTMLIPSFSAVIDVLNSQLEEIDEKIKSMMDKNEKINNKYKTLQTIPGVGHVTAAMLVVLLPELGTTNRRAIASLAGLAPHPNESGNKIGYRRTRGGRADIKPIMFMAAMAAARSNSHLADFYNKMVKSGKKKMVALTALMRKQIIIANARIKELEGTV